MSENVKNWLFVMYESEIKEVQANISNIKVWLCGSPTEEEQFEYTEYLKELEDYLIVLNNLKNQAEGN